MVQNADVPSIEDDPAWHATPQPVPVGAVEGVTANGSSYCVLAADGEVRCAGNIMLDVDDGGGIDSAGLRPVPGLPPAVAIGLGKTRHACALLPDGAVQCWGSYLLTANPNFNGATTIDSVRVSPGDGYLPIATGALDLVPGRASYALMDDGTVRAWGDYYLGDGSTSGSLEAGTVLWEVGAHSPKLR